MPNLLNGIVVEEDLLLLGVTRTLFNIGLYFYFTRLVVLGLVVSN